MVRCLNCMKIYEEQYNICPHCGFIKGTPPKEAYHLSPGANLTERYMIGTVLGFGGFGITYRAWDNILEKMVAVKEFYPNGIVNRIPGQSEVIIYTGERANEFQKGKERFLAEARNMAKFSTHPNIVNVYDFFEANNTAYIVMEYLDGISYKQYIASNGGKVDPQVAVEVTLSVLDALKEIHKSKIIHRDISPDNIFICREGNIKVIDFGAARFSTGEEEKTLSIILKPGYAPPEQYRSKSRQGPWTDIYALGAVLYRALTGIMPDESVNRMVSDNLKSPQEIDPAIPEYLSNAVMRAMALNQELRFQNVNQFRMVLQNKEKVLDVATELKKRKKFRGVGVAIISAVILLSGALCYQTYIARRDAAFLNEASLEVWLPVTSDETTETGEFERMLEEYETTYPSIEITVTPIPEAEYAERLERAIKDGEMPDLFDSTCLDSEYEKSLASLKDAYDLLETDAYYFLDIYKRREPSLKRIPLSFQMPVVYINSLLAEAPEGPISIQSLMVDGKESYSVNPADIQIYQKVLNVPASQPGYEEFRKKKTAFYLSDTQDYPLIQEEFAGMYKVAILENQDLEGRFTNLWSVSGSSPKDEKAAAIRLVVYLMSENSQDIFNVQNTHGLPLNKKIYEMYEQTNGDFLNLKECFDHTSFPAK